MIYAGQENPNLFSEGKNDTNQTNNKILVKLLKIMKKSVLACLYFRIFFKQWFNV